MEAYRDYYNFIRKIFTIHSGKMILYHGNVYNLGNTEIHKLYKLDEFFLARLHDVTDSYIQFKC